MQQDHGEVKILKSLTCFLFTAERKELYFYCIGISFPEITNNKSQISNKLQ